MNSIKTSDANKSSAINLQRINIIMYVHSSVTNASSKKKKNTANVTPVMSAL